MSNLGDQSPRFDRRPWGTFTVLDEAPNYKVKRIEVLPGKRLSYQKHAHRSEHWMAVVGRARVTLDGNEIVMSEGETVDIGAGVAHRIEALGSAPRPPGAEALKGGQGELRIRIGDWRIIYMVHDAELLVLVIKIGHRGDVYRAR